MKLTERNELLKPLTDFLAGTNLGNVVAPVESVAGGLLHKMYKVATDCGTYAVKVLNPQIMRRAGVLENYARAERLEKILEEHDIPIVPALAINGRKMQQTDGVFWYVFPWCNGKTTDWNDIKAEQCCIAGNILGRIHAIAPKSGAPQNCEKRAVDWNWYAALATEKCPEIAARLAESLPLLYDAQKKLNRANEALPKITCISNGDMDPKNIMWDADGKAHVIDLECLGYGNPVSHSLQLALQWAGVTTCDLSVEKLSAFMRGYASAFRVEADYAAAFGVAYTWIEWLEYNLKRALRLECADEGERKLGVSEALATLGRIAYIAQNEARIKGALVGFGAANAG